MKARPVNTVSVLLWKRQLLVKGRVVDDLALSRAGVCQANVMEGERMTD